MYDISKIMTSPTSQVAVNRFLFRCDMNPKKDPISNPAIKKPIKYNSVVIMKQR